MLQYCDVARLHACCSTGADVLVLTPHLRNHQREHRSVCNQVLLRKGGLLIANELTAKTDFLTLTFGLTDGWWLFEDAEWRIPGAPLLSRCVILTALRRRCAWHPVLCLSPSQ